MEMLFIKLQYYNYLGFYIAILQQSIIINVVCLIALLPLFIYHNINCDGLLFGMDYAHL